MKKGSIIYCFGFWLSIIVAYAIKGNLHILFSGSTLLGFFVATIHLVALSFILTAVGSNLSATYRVFLSAIWILLPVVVITLYMEICFHVFFVHTHGFGYVSGLGDSKKIWLLFVAISFFWSVISYWFVVPKKIKNHESKH